MSIFSEVKRAIVLISQDIILILLLSRNKTKPCSGLSTELSYPKMMLFLQIHCFLPFGDVGFCCSDLHKQWDDEFYMTTTSVDTTCLGHWSISSSWFIPWLTYLRLSGFSGAASLCADVQYLLNFSDFLHVLLAQKVLPFSVHKITTSPLLCHLTFYDTLDFQTCRSSHFIRF